jgi:thioesterase domain-containing protein
MSVWKQNRPVGDEKTTVDVARATTDRPVVFLFPGISGLESEVGALRSGCAASLSFIPVVLPDWIRCDSNLISLDGLVKHCIAQIDRYQQRGPVLLAGYSFGGHVALAVAAALDVAGRQIGCLALLDTSATPPIEDQPLSLARPGRRLVDAVRNRAVGPELARIAGALIVRARSKSLSRFLGRLPSGALPPTLAERLNVSITMSFNIPILAELLAWMTQTSSRFRFPAVLFRCVEQELNAPDDLGWSRHLANLRVVPIPGGHVSLTSPENLPSLCEAFTAAITGSQIQTQGSLA